MPVWKFQSFEAARRALWLEPGDPVIPRKFGFVLAMADLARDIPFARGVHRYRSIEEADAAREAWIDDRVRRIQDGRHARLGRAAPP